MKNQLVLIGIFLFSLLSVCTLAQRSTEPIKIGEKHLLYSDILDEERTLLIYTPENYSDSTRTFPVMYLLDGYGNFHHTTACVRFLAKNGRIPEMIVIGIPNTEDRTHDLTPPITSGGNSFPTAGGADSMLTFINKEVKLYVQSALRVNGYEMLVGHSFGGLFAIHVLTHSPGSFDSYLAISPSLWWDNQYLVKEQINTFLKENNDMKGHLYITMGNEGNTMVGGAWKLIALLEEKGPPELRWEFNRMPDQTHGSIPHLSTYHGLEFIFSEWNIYNSEEQFAVGGGVAIAKYEDNVLDLYGFTHNLEEGHFYRLSKKTLEEGNPDIAISILQRGAMHYPDSWKIHALLGIAYEQTKQNKKAINHLKKALAINNKDKQSMVALQRLGEDVSDYLPDLQLTTEQLIKYSGRYVPANQKAVDIIAEEGVLWAESPGMPRMRLSPIGKHQFYVELQEAEVEFILDGEKISEMLIKLPGMTMKAIRQ